MSSESKEVLVGIFKSGLAAIPYAGGFLNEICFDIRGRIAQKRVNDFANSFIEYIKGLGLNIDENVISSEMFNDIYFNTETR
jgi:hypothetical protein